MENRERILVVDDEAVICELMKDFLTEQGYSVETATDPRAALDILKSNGFVLLLTDIKMPEMDGIELIHEARKVRPSLIPIVMTGFATIETARAAVKEGAYDYLLKPFNLSEIKVAVTNALERNRLLNENARLREVTELFNISERIAGFHDEGQLLDFVLKAALERVEAERGSIMMATPDGKALRVAASVGLPEEATHAVVDIGSGISGRVAQQGQPLLVGDIQMNAELMEISSGLQDSSFASVPLERKQPEDASVRSSPGDRPEILAVLNVNRKRNGAQFTDGDLKILSIIANHAAVAIENAHLMRDVESAHVATLESMARILEAKDAYTRGHSDRVRNFSVLAAQCLGMSEQDTETLRTGAALHDLGKVGVSDAILNKTEPLTEAEWEVIKQHPLVGPEILKPVPGLSQDHLALVRGHHERIDGAGYPDGVQGSHLPDLVRVMAVADCYDAMSSDRAYRRGMTPEEVIRHLKHASGNQLDAKVVSLFVELISTGCLSGKDAAGEREPARV